MSLSPLFLRFAAAIAIFLLTGAAGAREYLLFYLGGQSNMDGYGYTKDLSEDQKGPVDGVMIYHGNISPDGEPADGRGVWAELRSGHGVGFKSDGKNNDYSDRFGLELSFGKRIRELYPDAPIALIKYAKGGTSIDGRAARTLGCWDPDFEEGEGAGKGMNQYDNFLATLRHSAEAHDIDGDGETDKLVPTGILWMQGESDANFTREVAEAYQDNLGELMNLIRAALRVDDLPVAIGRITDSGRITGVWKMDHGDVVRSAQAAFAQEDGNAVLVTTTDNYQFSDDWHYDSPGYLDLGGQFADALAGLLKN